MPGHTGMAVIRPEGAALVSAKLLVEVCMKCGDVRDDERRVWRPLEAREQVSIRENGVGITHGACAKCSAALLQELRAMAGK